MAGSNGRRRDTGNGESRRQGRKLPDDAVERAKQEVLYGVGYKRPPTESRFRKGQSGNPKGRPKRADPGPIGDSSLTALILREGRRLVTIREGEETKQIASIEAVVRAQKVSAIKGNSHYAQKHFIERFDRSEREARACINEDNEWWETYVTWCRQQIADAEEEGEPPPQLLPHPDDVVIDAERGVRFVGPINEEQAAAVEETCRLRDVLLMQDALDRRPTVDLDVDYRPGTALVFADLLNKFVPLRFRLSDDRMLVRMCTYAGTSKRKLLKNLHAGWQGLGRQARRGLVFPPLRVGKAVVDQLAQVLDQVRDRGTDH